MVDGSELPSKTIAEIKTKIQINKRGRITDTDVISAARSSEINTNSFERVWRTRESILQCTIFSINFYPTIYSSSDKLQDSSELSGSYKEERGGSVPLSSRRNDHKQEQEKRRRALFSIRSKSTGQHR